MKKAVCIVFVSVILGVFAVHSGHCENPSVNPSAIGPLDAPNSLDFDDMPPCLFIETIPIPPTFYKHYGFTIKGPNEKSGGAVLDECSGMGVTGYSPPNFLAFDCGSVLSTGGRPILPEKIFFTPTVRGVSLKIGSGQSAGETIALTVKNDSGKVIDTETVTLTDEMQTINLTSTKRNIKRLFITLPEGSNACAFIIDDILTTP